MKKVLFAGLLATTAFVVPAQADLVRFDDGTGGNAGSFIAVGGAGFGALPRALTLQTNTTESGAGVPNGSGGTTNTGDAIAGADKTNVFTLGSLGWAQGNNVAIGFNADQTGNSGITLSAMTLSIYSGTTVVATYSLASPVVYTLADLQMEPGNGNALFAFVLDSTQQAAFTAANFPSTDFAGLSATLTGTNDGPDSFIMAAPGLVPGTQCTGNTCSAVPGPIAGAGLPGLIAAAGALMALVRRRRRAQRFSQA